MCFEMKKKILKCGSQAIKTIKIRIYFFYLQIDKEVQCLWMR